MFYWKGQVRYSVSRYTENDFSGFCIGVLLSKQQYCVCLLIDYVLGREAAFRYKSVVSLSLVKFEQLTFVDWSFILL
jgi:hypothetical protein